MAAFPTVKFSWDDLTDDTESVMSSAPMERGKPKVRRDNSDARNVVTMTVYFDTKAEAAAFSTWFNVDINAGADEFSFTNPRTGVTYQARIVGGKLGALKHSQRTLEASQRQVSLEYWTAAY